MCVLITGYRGFVGRALVSRLEDAGLEWRPFTGDVTHAQDFESLASCRCVVHLAGLARPRAGIDPAALYDVNLGGTLNVAKFAVKHGLPMLFAGSCPYAPQQSPPFHEDMRLDTRNLGPYAASKALADELLLSMGRKVGLRGMAFRIFNLYGPGQPRGFLIPDILDIIASNHTAGRCAMRALHPIRDFVHIDDLIDLILLVLQDPTHPMQPLNVGSGIGTSVRAVAEKLLHILEVSMELEDQKQPCAIHESYADIGKASRLFGWSPRISLDAGLRTVIEREPAVRANA